MPVVYHVPAEIKQPWLSPETCTSRYPLPLNGPLVEVGELVELVVLVEAGMLEVDVGDAPSSFGKYLTVSGQSPEVVAAAGWNLPSATVPTVL